MIDGRQQYHQFGVWTWLAGSYPHPLGTDEQPGSFRAFPDLHFDRVTADRQRWMAWNYRVRQYVPTEILPGFITYQTMRADARSLLHRDRFRPRDWDLLGWRFSLLSSIATAPMNHVVNMLPARDPDEFRNFPEADRRWFRDWLDWTDRNREILRNLRPIFDQPGVGRVDGTAAFEGDRGFLFAFNPNYRRLPATFRLDDSIGLAAKPKNSPRTVRNGGNAPGAKFLLRQLYPEAERGRLIAAPSGGAWTYGEKVTLSLPGTDALVLEVLPAPEQIEQPLLFDTIGKATVNKDRLLLRGITAEAGAEPQIHVLLPSARKLRAVEVNGASVPFVQSNARVSISLRFAGTPFSHAQQIGRTDPSFTGGSYQATIAIPTRIFQQLEKRRKHWPTPYTEDDLQAAWLGSDRLLLFVDIADPSLRIKVSLKIDGRPISLRPAFTRIYPEEADQTFVGWYADVSALRPETPHVFEVQLPPLLPGQFQGLFLDNIEPEFTRDLALPQPVTVSSRGLSAPTDRREEHGKTPTKTQIVKRNPPR